VKGTVDFTVSQVESFAADNAAMAVMAPLPTETKRLKERERESDDD